MRLSCHSLTGRPRAVWTDSAADVPTEVGGCRCKWRSSCSGCGNKAVAKSLLPVPVVVMGGGVPALPVRHVKLRVPSSGVRSMLLPLPLQLALPGLAWFKVSPASMNEPLPASRQRAPEVSVATASGTSARGTAPRPHSASGHSPRQQGGVDVPRPPRHDGRHGDAATATHAATGKGGGGGGRGCSRCGRLCRPLRLGRPLARPPLLLLGLDLAQGEAAAAASWTAHRAGACVARGRDCCGWYAPSAACDDAGAGGRGRGHGRLGGAVTVSLGLLVVAGRGLRLLLSDDGAQVAGTTGTGRAAGRVGSGAVAAGRPAADSSSGRSPRVRGRRRGRRRHGGRGGARGRWWCRRECLWLGHCDCLHGHWHWHWRRGSVSSGLGRGCRQRRGSGHGGRRRGGGASLCLGLGLLLRCRCRGRCWHRRGCWYRCHDRADSGRCRGGCGCRCRGRGGSRSRGG